MYTIDNNIRGFHGKKGVLYMEVDVEYLNKWASLTGERARLEANQER